MQASRAVRKQCFVVCTRFLLMQNLTQSVMLWPITGLLRAPSTMLLLCLKASAWLCSFTAAGAELRLTQGAVSRQTIALESRLDTRLFVRRKAAPVLTEAGRYYANEIAPLLARLERAAANVMALKGRGGLLTLSVGASLGSYWLIPRLPALPERTARSPLTLPPAWGLLAFPTQRLTRRWSLVKASEPV